MTQFEEAIKEYLDKAAAEDPLFKAKYEAEDKSLQDCCDYIISEVHRQGRKGYTDGEIYQMARHYYNEKNEDLKIDKHQKDCKVVTNKETQEKFTNSKPKAKQEEIDEGEEDVEIEKEPIVKKQPKPKSKPKDPKTNPNQLTFFDLLGEDFLGEEDGS